MDITRQIAQQLKVSPLQVKRVESWDKVYLVILYGRRPTFVSKKVNTVDSMTDDALLESFDLENGLRKEKLRLNGQIVIMYTNFHTNGNFALRVCNSKATVYIDGEEDSIWIRRKTSCKAWTRTDGKYAKSINGVLNRCRNEGLL